jgi:O-antigen/teichoic acid export membrane protein
MSIKSVAKGTLIITIGLFLTRIIGLLYQIPILNIIGPIGGIVLNASLIPFIFVNQLTTSGIPPALSRIMSANDTQYKYKENAKVMYNAQVLLTGISIVVFVVLFVFADAFSNLVYSYDPEKVSIEQVNSVRGAITNSIRIIALAALFVPQLSLYRGILQSKSDLAPVSKSFILEQVVKVLFGLGIAYAIYISLGQFNTNVKFDEMSAQQLNGIYTIVNFQNLAIVLASLVTVIYIFRKAKVHSRINRYPDSKKIDPEIMKTILIVALPLIIVALDFVIFNFMDLVILDRAFTEKYATKADANIANNAFLVKAQKLARIPSAVVVSLEMALIPIITSYIVKKDYKSAERTINDSFIMLIKLLVPATVFMFIFAGPIYSLVFYNDSAPQLIEGIKSLQFSSLMMLTDIVYFPLTVLAIALKRPRYIYRAFFAGILTKLLFTYLLAYNFGVIGAALSYVLSYLVMGIILMDDVNSERKLKINFFKRQSFQRTVIAAIVMIFVSIIGSVALEYLNYREFGTIKLGLVIIFAAILTFGLYLSVLQIIDKKKRLIDHFKVN